MRATFYERNQVFVSETFASLDHLSLPVKFANKLGRLIAVLNFASCSSSALFEFKSCHLTSIIITTKFAHHIMMYVHNIKMFEHDVMNKKVHRVKTKAYHIMMFKNTLCKVGITSYN